MQTQEDVQEVLNALNGDGEQRPSGVPLVFGQFGQVQPKVRYVASVHFMDKVKKMPHQGETVYRLPAPKKGEYSVLAVYDTQQWVKTSQQMDEEPIPTPMPIDVTGIVRDLIASWTVYIGEASRFRPGIMEIKDSVPTPAELEQMLRMEEQFADSLIGEADKFHVNKSGRIQPLHRKAATWREVAREWNIEIRTGETHKRGAASGTIIPMEALVDGGVDLIDFYTKHDLDPMAYGDRYVVEVLKLRDQRRKQEKKIPVPTSNA